MHLKERNLLAIWLRTGQGLVKSKASVYVYKKKTQVKEELEKLSKIQQRENPTFAQKYFDRINQKAKL
jgi:hypothetical protein